LKELKDLDKKDVSHVQAKQYFSNLVIAFCGNALKFGWLVDNDEQKVQKETVFE